MLNVDRAARPRRALLPALLFLLLLPFVAGACISVDSDALATPLPSAGATAPGADSSPTSAPLAFPTPRPTPPPTPEPVAAEVVAFLPNWLIEDAVETIDTDLVTVAAFHSIEASGNGRLVSKKPSGDVPPGWLALEGDAFIQLKERLQAEGVKVVPVIQRVGWTEGARQRTINLLGKQKTRRALIANIVEFVSDRGFDGVNLDFEPLPDKVAEDYVTFVTELRAALDEADPALPLHLSIDVVPGLENYDLAALTADGAAHLAVIMGYGYRTDASGVAGSTAPLRDPASGDLATSVEAALAQADPDKLVLGLPWYGLAWSTESDTARSAVRSGKGIDGPSEANYGVAVGLAGESGRRYQPDQASAWTAYATTQCATCPATWRQVWYDDPDSFGTKIDFALEQDLAGVGIWALGMEDGREELWWVLRNRLRPRVDESPPHGTPSLDPEALRGKLEGRDVVVGSAPLWLFGADDVDGSGLALARIGLLPEVDGAGMLVTGRTYPPVERVDFPLGDESTGGSSEEGPRSIHVQWRDLAGNWSTPIVIEAHVLDPVATKNPADL